MRAAGMTIGAHGDRHLRLPTLSRDDQALEIDGALRVLDAVDASRQQFAYSYANGEHDHTSVELLRARVRRSLHHPPRSRDRDRGRNAGSCRASTPTICRRRRRPCPTWTTRAAEQAQD